MLCNAACNAFHYRLMAPIIARRVIHFVYFCASHLCEIRFANSNKFLIPVYQIFRAFECVPFFHTFARIICSFFFTYLLSCFYIKTMLLHYTNMIKHFYYNEIKVFIPLRERGFYFIQRVRQNGILFHYPKSMSKFLATFIKRD